MPPGSHHHDVEELAEFLFHEKTPLFVIVVFFNPSLILQCRRSQSLSESSSPPSVAALPSRPIPSVSATSGAGIIGGADGVRGFASSSPAAVAATAFDVSSLASSRVRDAVDLTRHYGRCYWELSKARLSLVVVTTSGTGFVLGSGSAVDIPGLCWTCGGAMMVAAAANSLNQLNIKGSRAWSRRGCLTLRLALA